MRRCAAFLIGCFLLSPLVRADGPRDNQVDKVRRMPPPGVQITSADRKDLEVGVAKFSKEIASFATTPETAALLPDVLIFEKAVRGALEYNEFFDLKEVKGARELLAEGRTRLAQLRSGGPKWTTAAGLVLRGYISKIDGSVQPYALVVPKSYKPGDARRHRLDVWLHGRMETLSELSFLLWRRKDAGEFTPADAFVLHPYGRYCNAFRFAGEVDVFEALAAVEKCYPIDKDRLVARGFSMGGAGCWTLATHHAGHWVAAAPGAGFSETADFLKVFQNEKAQPAWYERKLWNLYDSTTYAANLFNCPTIAYSGEIDKQRQAAEQMVAAAAAEGLNLVHLIGPNTAHKYHPESKAEINGRIDAIAAQGRDPCPQRLRFTTWTLRTNRMRWLTVDALGRHWDRARVDAEIADGRNLTVKTENVAALTLLIKPEGRRLENGVRPTIRLDGEHFEAPEVVAGRDWSVHFENMGRWRLELSADSHKLRKRHGLQGPIDDAFMESFLFVRPTGRALHPKTGEWVQKEMAHAAEHWRRQFRGVAPVKDDSAVTDADIAAHNLILWGDPSSNQLLSRVVGRLPLKWDAKTIGVSSVAPAGDAATHMPVLIYPNPLNPERYVVLNSGFTYREYDYLNNARQTPKLPDWALLDVSSPPTSREAGKVTAAGFFGEHWEALAAESN